MAWRLQEHVVRGEIDNRTRSRVTGRIWLAGIREPLVLDLHGDCHPDLAGCLVRFTNPHPIAMTTRPPAWRQRGKTGDITAARKLRVFEIPLGKAYAMLKAGNTPPEHMANSLCVEWHSDVSGHFVIESADFQLEVSEPSWRFTAEEIAQRVRDAREESSHAFAIEISADGAEKEWDEFRYEEFLRESDARGEKYRRLLEKYINHPDRDRIVAHEMGWTWLEEALDQRAEGGDETADAEDPFFVEAELPEPDPSREGFDWVRDEEGEIAHPIKKRATNLVYTFLDELRAAGNPQENHPGLADFVSHTMILSAKLAGALGSVARDCAPESGFTIASLKRALEVLHQALAAAGSLGPDTPFPAARLAYFRNELFAIREQVIALIATLREQ